MQRLAVPSLALGLAIFIGACARGEDDGEIAVGNEEGESDNPTLRRQAMNEWYHESQNPPEDQRWSREYRRFVLEAAKRERERWDDLLPHADDHYKAPLVTGTAWSNIGPNRANVIKNGTTSLNVTDSGRARSIIVDGQRIYVATAGGGVWRSDDLGGVWTPITESLGSLSCGSLAMDPVAHDTLYLGLGDPFDGTGIGLVKSTDGGGHWADPVFLGDSTIIPNLIVDPADRNIILAATNKGLYRSTDAGASFARVNLATGQAEQPYVWSLQHTGGRSFALALEALKSATTGTTDGQVWTSSDDGASWTRAATLTKPSGVGRITLASAPSNRQIVYAMAAIPNSTSSSDLADIFKSTDGGRTWTALNAAGKSYTNGNSDGTSVGTLLNGQGWYDHLVIVSPTDPNRVFFGGALLLARTTDGGSTFTQVSSWLGRNGLPYVHADFHAATFDTGGSLYVGSDGGVFVSADGGSTFTDALNIGIITHLLYSVGSSPQNRNAVIGGFQDNGTRVRSGTTSVFDQTLGGDGFGSNINLTNSQQMLGSLYYARIYKSTDGGQNFTIASTGITESNNSTTAPFITRIVAWEGSTTGNEVYTYSNLKVYKSTSYAGSWTSAGTPLTTGVIRNMGVAKSDAMRLGVVASGGRVYLSQNGGGTWTQVASGKRSDTPVPNPPPLPNSELSLSYVHFDVSNPNIVYVASVAPIATASHLWKSTDFGASWTAIDGGGFPTGVPVNVIKSDPSPAPGQPSKVLYAGTHLGVYRSTDGGATWSRFGSGMPLVSVTDVYISPDTSLVRAATYGRGFWDLDQPVVQSDFSLAASPSSVSAAQGGSGQTTVSTALVAGSAQTIALTASGLPSGATASFSPTSVTTGGSSTLTLAAGAGTPTGTFTVTVVGTAGTTTRTTTVSFTVNAAFNFSMSASPASVSAPQGGSAQSTVSTTLVSGSAQSIALSASGLPAGAGASFSPTSVSAGGSSTLTLTAGAATPAGSYTVTVTGTGGGVTRTTTVTFGVSAVANDFSLSASPASVSTTQGGSAQTTIATAVTSGSAQTIALSASGLPAGAGASFSPTSVSAGGSSTLTLTAGAATPAGSYTVTVTGTGGGVTRTTTVTFGVSAVASDFSIGANPTSVSAAQGGSAQTTISTAVTSGSAQTIALSASGLPSGAGATFNPTSVTAGGSAALTLTAGAATPAGSYTVTVTGTGSSATHSATVNLTVTTSGGETVLQNAVPVANLSGAASSQRLFRLDVPAGTSNLTFAISGGTGDADMYVKFGAAPTTASYDCRPYLTGNNETCSISSVQVGSYYVMLRGYTAYSGATLTGSYTTAQILSNGVPVTGISGASSSTKRWTVVSVPAGATLRVTIAGSSSSSSDADLYVRRGSQPTTTTYDCRPYLTGSNETCTLTNSSNAAADYHVMLYGYTAYSGVTLTGSF